MTPSAPPAAPGEPVALFLSGPTASGKSAVALELAERLGGEILSVDSMQVFRGMDIGTAKPSPADRSRVPHHLIDLVEPSEDFDAARWLDAARTAEAGVRARGRVPVFCGGTGLYFRAWFHGLDAPAPSDPALRSMLEATPLDVLLAELAERDPPTFSRIDRQNPRRVVRAIEILRLTGRPLERAPRVPLGSPAQVVALQRPDADLRRRIDARVEAMFRDGLVEETRRLRASAGGVERTAFQAIGYRQVLEHLDGGVDLASTIAEVKSRTWQFARRQRTWFRHQLPVEWLEVGDGESPETTAGRILARRDAGEG